jgi:hypothetical protein
MLVEMLPILKNPEHWLNRAAQTRAIAEQLTDAQARATMLEIADEYVRLAENAARRLSDTTS